MPLERSLAGVILGRVEARLRRLGALIQLLLLHRQRVWILSTELALVFDPAKCSAEKRKRFASSGRAFQKSILRSIETADDSRHVMNLACVGSEWEVYWNAANVQRHLLGELGVLFH